MAETTRFELNGAQVITTAMSGQTLLDFLRGTMNLMATRMGCGLGQCGACTVLVGDQAVAACDTLLTAVVGQCVTTLEGLGSRSRPHRLQTSFIDEQALQCGFCTSGMIMTAAALLARNPHPSPDQIRIALDGNLCRCGVHDRIVRAVCKAAS